jgi:hypothetical protein
MFFPALVAKLLSAGAVAQACTGAGVALVAFTGAGAAGVLPDSVQSTFTEVVGGETSEETPVEEPADAPVGELPAEGAPVEVPAEAPADVVPGALTHDAWATQGPAADQSFGAWVSYGSEHGWADGATVSCWAHHKNDVRKGREVTECGTVDGTEGADDSAEAGDGSEVESPEVESPEVEAPEVEAPEGAEAEQSSDDGGRTGSHGNGHENGNGNGSGKGDTGKGNGRD